ncbi:tyrosinase tyrosinase: common central domain protein [Rhizoctonia solani AG-3 Rhs1AP]|uniref:tyrosinase n=1 Tax=Rhizoctonia solani AG-3 Rhs1AP TaxID=1086054 RepID=X8J0J4_9AGAM|nr:tyrosinase tyrosinase: common central domain protein [Rhizoctonia solani AG-3 Rhs1AP]
MSAPYQVTGVRIPSSSQPHPKPHTRWEIRHLKEHYPKQFTLFILSFIRIMDDEFKPKAASFREIAGIHGMPYVPWLGDPDEARQTTRGSWLGYCNHASILFPGWHRPYIMALEQIISDVAHGIADKFAEKKSNEVEGSEKGSDYVEESNEAEEWMDAADKLRFPFWDWTDPQTGVEGIPNIFQEAQIKLVVPQGEDDTYDNPLAFYKLDSPVEGFDNRWQPFGGKVYRDSARAYYKEWKRTFRNPYSRVNTVDNYAGINAILKDKNSERRGTWANLTNDVAGTFAFPLNIPPDRVANAWDEFSNTTFQSAHQDPLDPKKITSPYVRNATPLEQSHNTVHLVVGGVGHMVCITITQRAFDPIFFLHHCNIDRLLAFWEHIYPNYVAGTEGYLNPDGITRTSFTQSGGTWVEKNNQEVNDASPLLPFRNSKYSYWTAQLGHSLKYHSNYDGRPTALYNKCM